MQKAPLSGRFSHQLWTSTTFVFPNKPERLLSASSSLEHPRHRANASEHRNGWSSLSEPAQSSSVLSARTHRKYRAYRPGCCKAFLTNPERTCRVAWCLPHCISLPSRPFRQTDRSAQSGLSWHGQRTASVSGKRHCDTPPGLAAYRAAHCS